ncbi:cornifelin homolog B-like [Paralichthys olivaceus]|uniref:cornifelin homolog B-like n=1 Tax=Paralichthys olivaceus TaxID=8255 RepID=UPI00097DEFF0|nr:PREDICTED: cornifelin homolog B-like [Paralichthys olivaceus]
MTGTPLLRQDLFPQSFPQWQQDSSLHQVQIQQPMAYPKARWNIDLCYCCEDSKFCCFGFWCCCCNACTLSEEFGQHRCLPMCDICTPACTACCGLPCCIPPAGLALRVAIRHKYGIEGTLINDILISSFCMWCSWCQMRRELKYRKENPPVINMQPQPEMMAPAVQPTAPVMRATGFVVASY